ncbi:MAG: sugar nucleotide-binding protein [Candidatus Micrarchaeia archaeon]|jgi:dTDP-4-dehydrorhamnose reductase
MDLLLGAKGKLGSALSKLLPDTECLDRQGLDVTNRQAVNRLVAQKKPANVINCTGFTDVDACEANPGECWKVNVYAVENMLEACEKTGSRLVHFSSDFVVEPVNEYAKSKLAAEKMVEKHGLAIRTNFYTKDTFIIKKLLQTKEKVPAFADQLYNPISIQSLATEAARLVKTKRTGIANIGTSRAISPFEFATLAAKQFGLAKGRIVPASVASMKVPRPKNTFIQPENALMIEEDLRRFADGLGKNPEQL